MFIISHFEGTYSRTFQTRFVEVKGTQLKGVLKCSKIIDDKLRNITVNAVRLGIENEIWSIPCHLPAVNALEL